LIGAAGHLGADREEDGQSDNRLYEKGVSVPARVGRHLSTHLGDMSVEF
jgi:hypothetical protein